MKFRVYSHKHQFYTNSVHWPSNQRTWSEWVLTPDGRILEIIHVGLPDREDTVFQYHDKKDFSVEAWTGFFDSKGQKIYLGDIIKLQCFNLDYEVVWHFDRFGLKPLYETVNPYDGVPDYFRGQKDLSVDWIVTNNIHNAEYSE